MWKIDGILIKDEEALREHCANNITQSGKPFKQDFRVAANAYRMAPSDLLALVEHLGHTVEKVEEE